MNDFLGEAICFFNGAAVFQFHIGKLQSIFQTENVIFICIHFPK